MIAETFNETRTFGVEFEAFGEGTEPGPRLPSALAREGIDARWHNYTHAVVDHWKVTTDADVDERYLSTGTFNGYEVNSPILHGHEGLRQVEKVVQTIEATGGFTNAICGLHVHHGIDRNRYSDHPAIFPLVNVFLLALDYADAFDRLVPVSRRNGQNNRCAKLDSYYSSGMDLRTRLIHSASTDDIINAIGDRYVTVNPYSIEKYGTVEFRQQGALMDTDLITHWIALTQRVMDWASAGRYEAIEPDTDSLSALFATIDLPECERDYWYSHCDMEQSEYDDCDYAPYDAVGAEELVECYECGAGIPDGDECMVHYDAYCPDCYRELFFTCERCDDETSRDEMEEENGYFLCPFCAECEREEERERVREEEELQQTLDLDDEDDED